MDEFIVNSLPDYLKWAKDCHKVYVQSLDSYYLKEDEGFDNHVFFRGHASCSWHLNPSLFRDSSACFDEHDMLRQACNLTWSQVSDCKTNLEKLVILQHFGLKTRLLDVSYNPLVALYFACGTCKENENEDSDGVVFSGVMKETPLNICHVIADYVFNHSSDSEIDELFLRDICERHNVVHSQLADCCFFNPPLNNPRITAQNGAFIMSPLLRKHDYKLSANSESVENTVSTVFNKKCVIPKALKNDLLRELDWMGINRATLFTDISSKLEYINLKQEQKWQRIALS